MLCTDALPDLMGVAKLAVEKQARAVNYIAFNPFVDQACGGKRSAENVPKYSDVMSYLLPAIDLLDAHGIEVNVRYLPFCLFPEKYRKFLQNFQQITYDLHEWEAAGEAWSSQSAQRESLAELSEPIDFFRLHRNAQAARLQPGARAAVRGTAMGTVGGAHTRRDRGARRRCGSADRRALRQRHGRPGDSRSGEVAAGAERPVSPLPRSSRPRSIAARRDVHGLPWETPEWLADNPTDIVLNTSESSRGAITASLKAVGLESRHDRSLRSGWQAAGCAIGR